MLKSICADIEQQLRLLAGSPSAEAALAQSLLALRSGRQGTPPGGDGCVDDLAWRLAWLVFVLAPSLDESLIVTMPMRLEMIAAQRMRVSDVLDDIRGGEYEAQPARAELATAVALQLDLPNAPARRLRTHVESAIRALESDPGVLDRVIEAIANEGEVPWLEAPFGETEADLVLSLSVPSSRRSGLA